MELVNSLLIDQVKEELTVCFQYLYEGIGEVEIEPTKEAKYGDYQCTLPLKLSKILERSPRDIAMAVVEKVER